MNPVVGIGELLWDVFPDGRKVAGGAPFNFAFHCRQLGHDAVIVSRVGDDDLGRELRTEVRRLGLSDEFIQTDPEHPTGTVRVTVDAVGQPSYEIVEDVAWDYIGWDEKLVDLASKYSAVCFGTLARRKERPKDEDGIFQFLKHPRTDPDQKWDKLSTTPPSRSFKPLRVADINLRPPHIRSHAVLWCHVRADWLKMSMSELQFLKPRYPNLPEKQLATPRNYYDCMNWEKPNPDEVLLVTDGERGVTIVQGTSEYHKPAIPARVVDTVGAGDSFTAAMVCLHLEGRPLAECARFATHYAARVCEHRGATPRIDRAEVERAAFGDVRRG